jgi:hypothetical protein
VLRVGANYSEAEVARMVAYYPELAATADTTRGGLRFLVWVADLEVAMGKLDLFGWKVVLLHGLLGMPQRTVAELLETSQRKVNHTYADAIEDIAFYINGGTHD